MSELDRLVARGVVTARAELGSLTTYRFGGPARYLAEPLDREALDEVIAARIDEPVLVLGRGSNLVISDSGFD
ncbi:MAG: UDP-N-acetylenolpyruvoylglucosamine reductase, partial [Acidimicrobiia bacterium]|nr:UDP-N-acetylenolpyruvoylglucosamine reductase [Acidimicrobiia bacterium]